MSRAYRALAVLAGVGLASAPRAFVQEKSTSGVPISWPSVPVTYKINMSGFQGGCASTAAAATVARTSVATWQGATRSGESSPCTSFSFGDGGDTTATALANDGTNLIVVRKGLCSDFQTSDRANCTNPASAACIEAHNCWSHDPAIGPGAVLALTTVTSSTRAGASTGDIIDADMEIYGWDGNQVSPTGLYFTCVDPPALTCTPDYGQSNCIEFDLASTVTHEAGHMLGLDHTPVAGATMAPTAAKGETEKRSLAADDIEGVCTIYPVGKSSGGGCSTGGGGFVSLLGVALLLRRRFGTTR